MSSFRFLLRTAGNESDESSLFIRVIHSRRSSSFTLPYRLRQSEWDTNNATILYPEDDLERFRYVKEIEGRIKRDSILMKNIIAELTAKGEMSAENAVKHFSLGYKKLSILKFASKTAAELDALGQERTADAYRGAAKKFISFTENSNMSFAEINADLLCNYEKWLKSKGCKPNTISFYMRNLRALYYRAVKAKVAVRHDENIFSNVYTGNLVTRKPNLSEDHLSRLIALLKNDTLPDELKFSLNLFLFSFLCKGISFVDVCYLRKSDIQGDHIIYRRKKTGQRIEIFMLEQIRTIITKYGSQMKSSPYVFNLINNNRGDLRKQYESALRLQNIRLKRLATLAKIDIKLTSHTARHSWATMAKRKDVSLRVISESLGHSNEKTTYIYLGSLERNVLDVANEMICSTIIKAI